MTLFVLGKDTDSLSLQSHKSFHVKTSEKDADYEEYTKKKSVVDIEEKNKMHLKYKVTTVYKVVVVYYKNKYFVMKLMIQSFIFC